MRNQHPGMSQPRPGQQRGFSDIQLLQQHLMYKQLQDIQRQRQLQQLDLGGRQQNSLGQLSDVERQAAVRQSSSPVLSGMPINNASNYTYSNELMGAESRTTNSSLMFLAGNMNWPRCEGPPVHGISTGPMFSHDQGQMMRPMGIIPPHGDQSLYGTPVSSTRYSLNNYPQPQGLFQNDVMNKAGGDPAEKASMQPVVFNHLQNAQFVVPEHDCSQDGKLNFQGKSLFGNAPVQGINSGSMSGNFKQVNHFSRSVGDKEFQDGQEQENWLGRLQQNKVPQIGPSCGVANLDPTEAKLLFGTDNDGNWDGSFGESTNPNTGGYLHGNPIQSSDHSSAFPSIHSGSWSALMLDALEASSSDTGIQEEWSGLSFQKTELSTGNHYALLNDNGKQQTTWDDSNLQNASSLTSRPFTLFDDADASPNHYTAPSFQQSSTKFAYEHNERASADVSHESSQQSSKEANINQLDHSNQRKQFVGSNLQEQTFENASNGVWTGHMYGQPVSTGHSTGMEFNLQKMQLVWDRQQKMPTQNVSNLSSGKSNGWNINQTFAPSEDNTSNIPDKRAQNDIKRTMHKERNGDGNKWKVGGNQASVTFPSIDCGRESVKSETGHPKMHNEDSNMENFAAVTDFNASKLNQEVKQQVFHQHQLNYGTHVAVGSSQNNKADENVAWFQNQLSRDPQTMDSSIYGTDKREEPGERFDHKQESRNPRDVPNEGFTSNHSHPSQHTGSEGCPKENSLLARNDPGPLVTSSQKSSGQSGRKIMGPRSFQYHPMGNMEMDVESAGSHNHTLYTRDAYQSVVQGLKNQEQGFVGRSQFASYVVPPSSMNLGKDHFTDLQSNAKAADEIQSRGTIPNHDSTLYSFDGSATHVSLNTRSGEASHNMLELLHKVDQSTNNSNFSDNNAPSEIPDEAATDGSACLQQDHSSALHGFGLKLAPPSQRQPIVDHDLPSQASLETANYFGSSNADSDAGGKDSKLLSNSSVQSLPPANDVSKSANLDIISSMSEQMNKQPSYSHTEGRSLAFTPSTFPYARNQSPVQQQQQQLLQQQLHHHHQQQQQQQISSATGSSLVDQSANLSGNQVGIDAQVKHSSHPRQVQDSHDENASDQPAQGSLPTLASRIPPFRLTPSGDTCASAASQFHLFNTGPSQPINSSSQLRSSGQQLPIGEIRSAARSSSTSGMSPQGFSTVLHNVWSSLSAQQRLSLIQAQKIIPKLPQSTSPLPNSIDTNSWTPEKADDQSNKKGRNAPSEFGTCSTNSQQFTYAEEYLAKGNSSEHLTPERVGGASKTGGASQGQELWPNHPSDGNSAFAMSSLAHLHQQDLSRGKHTDDSSLDSLKEHVSVPNNDVQKQNYSLLQQVQAMKGADSDPSNRAGKRLKGADFGATVLRELDATSPCSSFPSDVKMLSFSRKNEDERADTSSQFISREKSSEDMLTYRPHNLQNHSHSLNKISTLTFARGNECPQLHSQMAASWFEQCRSYKNGQTITTNDGPGNSQSSAQVTAQQYFFAKVSESMNSSIVVEERDATQLGSLQKSASSTALAANVYSSPHCIPSNVINNNAVLIPKKRKTATSELLPWYKEVTQGSRRMRNISMAELDWAQATYRLIEKVEDEFEMIEYGSSMTPRRRLILTTQLMQQLLPSIPARFFSADDTTSYESVTYFLAKLALGDACSLISCSQSDSLVHSNSGNMIPEKIKTSEKERDHFLLKAMEDYLERSRRLESDLLRLESRSSILDVRVECEDLGRCSIINRLAKFHGRAQTEGIGSSSNPEVPPRRIFPQRHVTAHAVTANLPEGVRCLSL